MHKCHIELVQTIRWAYFNVWLIIRSDFFGGIRPNNVLVEAFFRLNYQSVTLNLKNLTFKHLTFV